MNPDAGGTLPEENRVIPILINFVASPRESAAKGGAPSGEGSFMQSPVWARFKTKTGWKAFIASPRSDTEPLGRDLVVLVRPLGLGFYFAYVPMDPARMVSARTRASGSNPSAPPSSTRSVRS